MQKYALSKKGSKYLTFYEKDLGISYSWLDSTRVSTDFYWLHFQILGCIKLKIIQPQRQRRLTNQTQSLIFFAHRAFHETITRFLWKNWNSFGFGPNCDTFYESIRNIFGNFVLVDSICIGYQWKNALHFGQPRFKYMISYSFENNFFFYWNFPKNIKMASKLSLIIISSFVIFLH